jgi:PAS domain S-box-containing protein
MLRLSQQQFMDKIHPDDRAKFFGAIAGLTPENPTGEVTYRALTSDGTVWLKSNGRGFFDAEGKLQRVIGMVADVTGQRLAEEALRASEERLRMGQWAAHVGTFDVNIRTGADIWTPETEALYGLPPGGFGGSLTAFENLIHPDDRKQVMELTHKMMRTGEPTEGEWRVVWPDGSVHWIASRGQVLMDESGEPSRMLGVNLDITERKRAEEALSDMTRKLVEAQEQERVRIARELHDDINQRLALVAIGLDQLREKHTDLPTKVRDKMQELQHMTADISSGVYAMSHDLHPLTPDPSDLAMAMRGWCNEFGKRQKMEIIFRSNDLPRVPQAVSLCLFRVLQEALHNSARHSGVKRVEVQLAKNSGHIDLIVSDSGKGFDIKAARQSQGLGVTSMQERVRLIGGTIVIDAKLLAGTTIHVCVPFKPERDGQRQVAPD